MPADFGRGGPAPIEPVSVCKDNRTPVFDQSLPFAIETADVRDSERGNSTRRSQGAEQAEGGDLAAGHDQKIREADRERVCARTG